MEGTECSPGVGRMMAVVGSETSFDRGREQLELLAGLEVTAKAVERQSEAIGTDIAKREQEKVGRAVQLELPQILGPRVSKFYIEIDGTQVPVVRAETEGRAGRIEGQQPRTREVKLGCVFTQTKLDERNRPIRDEHFPGAIQIVDIWHAREHIWNVGAKRFPSDDKERKR